MSDLSEITATRETTGVQVIFDGHENIFPMTTLSGNAPQIRKWLSTVGFVYRSPESNSQNFHVTKAIKGRIMEQI